MTISADGLSVSLLDLEGAPDAKPLNETAFEDYGIVQRLFHAPTNTTAFVVAGIGTTGTTGATHYLANNWRTLSKRFGQEPFAVCLGFQNVQSNPNSFLEPVVILRFPDRQ
jgi:hypothetical protein